MNTMNETKKDRHQKAAEAKNVAGRWRRGLIAMPAALLLIAALYSGYVYAVSPASIRTPSMEHYHFRMQVIAGGKAVDFGKQRFQTPYEKGQCTAELSELPIH